MRTSKIIGIAILFLVWLWLVWSMLSLSGVNLRNLLLAAMSGIIVFVPLYRKYFGSK